MSDFFPEGEPRPRCALCGDYEAWESHYGPRMGLCFYCAESAANLYWMAHAGRWLTWQFNEDRPPAKTPVPQKLKWEVLRSAGFTCAQCGAQDRPMHVDHIIPRAKGGGNDRENLQALCDRCNIKKGAK